MTRKRKTFSVEKIKEIANKWLAMETVSQEEKEGIINLLEKILHETGNYRGFSYVYWDDKGFEDWCKAGEPEGTEKKQYIGPEYSRRYY